MATQQELWQKAVSDFMGGPDYPKDPILLVNEHNDLLITNAICAAADRGVQPSSANVKEVVRGLTERGLLVYVANVQPVPTPTLPHQEKFVGVDSIERAIKYRRTYKIPDSKIAAFNELLEYLTKAKAHSADNNFPTPTDAELLGTHNADNVRSLEGDAIRGRDKNAVAAPRSNASARSKEVLLGRVPTTEVDDSPFRAKVQSSHKGETQEGLGRKNTENLTASERSTEYGQIVQRLSDLRPADVGSFGATSRVEKLTRFKNKWVMEISALKARSVPDGKIREKLETAISELQSTSIR